MAGHLGVAVLALARHLYVGPNDRPDFVAAVRRIRDVTRSHEADVRTNERAFRRAAEALLEQHAPDADPGLLEAAAWTAVDAGLSDAQGRAA